MWEEDPENIGWLTIVRDGARMQIPIGATRPKKADDYVVRLFSSLINRGDVQPDDVLQSEEEIGDALGMSRFPVGEGMKKLRDKGFVAGSQGVNWRVARPGEKPAGESAGKPGTGSGEQPGEEPEEPSGGQAEEPSGAVRDERPEAPGDSPSP